MMNPILTWALRILQNLEETSVDASVRDALKLVGIDSEQVQVKGQPLESIFSMIGEYATIVEKEIRWQPLDAHQIAYPTAQADCQLEIPEPPGGWERFATNDTLALACLEKNGTFLPISPDVPYVSFYDAVKSAAAIHDCLAHGQPDAPFLLVSGDFSGIQEAIYTISSRGALKTLRGRSFLLELLTEHIVYEVQQATGASRYSSIFSGGGGLSLLVPNTPENQRAIHDFAQVLNAWIMAQLGSQLFLAMHCEPLCARDLASLQFAEKWEWIAEKLRKQKWRKFWDDPTFQDLFCPQMPKQLANQEACQITHRDDLPEEEMTEVPEVGRVSKLAYHLLKLGDRLTESTCIVRTSSTQPNLPDGTLRFPTHRGQYAAYQATQRAKVSDYDARWLVNSWNLEDYDEKTFPFLYADYVRAVADLPTLAQAHEKEEYQRDYGREMDRPEGSTASFSGLAKAAQGSELIGCMRMDVDDSGKLFYQASHLGIAALSNLSRSMNLFFKGYLNEICSMKLGDFGKKGFPVDITGAKSEKTNGRNVSIVYAGGDDLFIVGAWDDVAELAFDINTCFQAFSCENPEVHLSGGVTLHKPKFPLYQMARTAEQAEKAAKANQHHETEEEKNSLALFYSETLKRRNNSLKERIDKTYQEYEWQQQAPNRIAVAAQWHEYHDVIQLTKQLHAVYQELPHAFTRKLFETLNIWQEDGVLYLPMMFHTQRQFERIQPQTPALADLKTLLFRHDQISKLHIPLHWVEYLTRRVEGEN